MPIRFAPPWLRKLGSDDSPLVDDGEVQDEVARMKVRYEIEDRAKTGGLFAGPVDPHPKAPPTPSALTDILPTGEESDVAVPPTNEPPPSPPGLPSDLAIPTHAMPDLGGSTGGMALPSFIAPPSAPPPPPADRPPGTFRFEPNKYRPRGEEDESHVVQ